MAGPVALLRPLVATLAGREMGTRDRLLLGQQVGETPERVSSNGGGGGLPVETMTDYRIDGAKVSEKWAGIYRSPTASQMPVPSECPKCGSGMRRRDFETLRMTTWQCHERCGYARQDRWN